ncbi:unnamed protein product [marine sediment metagenome]|uniref:Uncharacterized protein n=1 Tax=marine sediment metagenome TaxID=412755 RepID=X0S2U3_9ZZZZ
MKKIIPGGTFTFKKVLEENASVLDPDGKGDKYYFLPFWFEKTGSRSYNLHSLGNLPKELTDELNAQRTGFKEPDMKVRYKTKQEMLATGFREDFTEGIEWFGEPGSCDTSTHLTTQDPHPYEGEDIKIKVTEEESKIVQEKAFAIGYKWIGSDPTKIHHPKAQFLFITKGRIAMDYKDQEYFDNHKNVELTPQQFLDGDLPEETEKFGVKLGEGVDWAEPGSFAFTGNDMPGDPYGSARSGEAKKHDAYIKDGYLFISGDKGEEKLNSVDVVGGYLYMYNLMSEETFKEKYSPKLKFKEWDVKIDRDSIGIGCVNVVRSQVNTFIHLMKKFDEYNVEGRIQA